MSRFVKEERPLEPNNAGQDPQAWANLADYEYERAEYYEGEVIKLEKKVNELKARIKELEEENGDQR